MKINAFRKGFIKYWKIFIPIISSIFLVLLILTVSTKTDVRKNGVYVEEDDVVLYIKKYHTLPKNYITKDGKRYYEDNNISLTNCIIGGDTFYNDGKLSDLDVSRDVALKECDLYYSGYNTNRRGSSRLIYETNTSENRVFVTYDHYETFKEITLFSIRPTYYVLLFILIHHSVVSVGFLAYVYFPYIKRTFKVEE